VIPFQFLISNILTLIVLIKLWATPLPGLWWGVLVLAIVDFISVKTINATAQEYGNESNKVGQAALIATVINLALIGLCIYALVKH